MQHCLGLITFECVLCLILKGIVTINLGIEMGLSIRNVVDYTFFSNLYKHLNNLNQAVGLN